jgi:hypothetical protein
MKNYDKISGQLPRHGYINELAKKCNCNRKTVTRALFHGFNGPKAEMVREFFLKAYSASEIEMQKEE